MQQELLGLGRLGVGGVVDDVVRLESADEDKARGGVLDDDPGSAVGMLESGLEFESEVSTISVMVGDLLTHLFFELTHLFFVP